MFPHVRDIEGRKVVGGRKDLIERGRTGDQKSKKSKSTR